MKKYKFLLFDSDNTLLDFDADYRIAIEKMYKNLELDKQVPYSSKILDIYETCNNRWWDKLEKDECTKEELFISRFDDFLDETGISGNAEKLNEVYFDELVYTGVPIDGAVEMMKKLSDKALGYEIHIVTNGYQHSAMPRLVNAGFGPYIGECFVSESVGYTKPHKEYFEYVFDNLNEFDHESAIVIGDSLTSDIKGANNAGIDSIWLNFGEHKNNSDIKPTYEVNSLDEIVEILT